MNTECARISDQARRAFTGQAWHGSSLKELLENVSPEQANAKPLRGAHSIWELVSHISVWVEAGEASARGLPMPDLSIIGTAEDWPPVKDSSAAAWSAAKDRLFRSGAQLATTIAAFPDDRLHDTVPGRKYGFYHLFHGIVQHSLYHGGQIAILKHG